MPEETNLPAEYQEALDRLDEQEATLAAEEAGKGESEDRDDDETPSGGHEDAEETARGERHSAEDDDEPGDRASRGKPQKKQARSEEGLPEWADPETVELAESVGIGKDRLGELSSRDELDRFVRLFDLRAKPNGQAGAEQTPPGGQEQAGQQAAGQQAAEGREESGAADAAFTLFPKLGAPPSLPAEFEPELRTVVDFINRRFAMLEQTYAKDLAARHHERVSREESAFDEALDALGHEDLYGTAEKTTPEQEKRRNEVFAAYDSFAGRRPTKAFVARAANFAHMEQLKTKERKALSEKLRASSRQRLGMGSRPRQPPATGDDIERELVELYHEMAAENG